MHIVQGIKPLAPRKVSDALVQWSECDAHARRLVQLRPLGYMPISGGEDELAHCVNEIAKERSTGPTMKILTVREVDQSVLLGNTIGKVNEKRRDRNVPSPTCTSHFDCVFDVDDETKAPYTPITTHVIVAVHTMHRTPCDLESTLPLPMDQENPRIPPSTIRQLFSEDILGSLYISWNIPSSGGDAHLLSYDIRVKDREAPGWSYIEKSFRCDGPEILMDGPSHSFYMDPFVWNLTPTHTYELSIRALNSAGVKGEYGRGIIVYKKKTRN